LEHYRNRRHRVEKFNACRRGSRMGNMTVPEKIKRRKFRM
jgi:hypothetical protein